MRPNYDAHRLEKERTKWGWKNGFRSYKKKDSEQKRRAGSMLSLDPAPVAHPYQRPAQTFLLFLQYAPPKTLKSKD